MANNNTHIEWSDATWSPVLGCRKVSEGCRHCYAMRTAWRMSKNPNEKIQAAYADLAKMTARGAEWTGRARFLPERLEQPLRWSRPRRIFVNSMSDLFHEDITDEQIAVVFAVMAAAHHHTFQVLTKRPERMLAWFQRMGEHRGGLIWSHLFNCVHQLEPQRHALKRLVNQGLDARDGHLRWPLPNVWLGVSVESQRHVDRIDALREVPAAVRFLSCEPLLGSLGELNLADIDWVIVGGESGPRARPMHPEWVREIRAQCAEQGVAFFFKQWGRWGEISWEEAQICAAPSRLIGYSGEVKSLDRRTHPSRDAIMTPRGKKHTGRLLDGRTWDEMPEPTP